MIAIVLMLSFRTIEKKIILSLNKGTPKFTNLECHL